MINYLDGKLTLTESSIRDLADLLGQIDTEKLSGEILICFLEIGSYVDQVLDQINSGN